MNKEEIDIRYTDLSDEHFLLKWMHNPQVNRWFYMASEEDIESGVKNWIGFSKLQASLTATIDNTPCGIATLLLLPYKRMAHQAQIYIAVDPVLERRGVGTALVKNLLNLAENYFRLESVYAEVYEGSPLLSLLDKFSFKEVAFQKNFVKDDEGYKARIILEKRFAVS